MDLLSKMVELTLFKKFVPLESKLKIFAKKLMEEPFYLSDKNRDYKKIWRILMHRFMKSGSNEFYEIGDFGGLIGFMDIDEGWKCELTFKLWDKSLWGKTVVRQGKELIKEIMNKYKLQRISTSSADEKVVKMAKLVGFKVEGRFKYAFKWNNELYTLHMLRILKEEL